MGNDPTRDGGTPDPLGGTDCAHPTVGGTDKTEVAEATDQYATRHNPFMFFHSIIDNTAECDANVVPSGTVTVGTPSTFNGTPLPDTFTGHLANDLSSTATTPKFGFVTPNLCDDGHDGTCAGTNVEGGKTGGLVAADLWLKHWMPLILASPSYQSGQMLVAVTFDEGGLTDTTACCNEQPGPNWAYPGFSPLLGTPPTTPGADPGGGRTGALLLNSTYIQPGTVDTTGSYNHYSALRSYEDLLGLTTGGADGLGHLGFAAASGLTPFGQDIFQPAVAPTITTDPLSQSVYSGNTLTFSAGASIVTPTVQWQVSVNGGQHLAQRSGVNNAQHHHGAAYGLRERLGGPGGLHQPCGDGDHRCRHHHRPARHRSRGDDPADQPVGGPGGTVDLLCGGQRHPDADRAVAGVGQRRSPPGSMLRGCHRRPSAACRAPL